MKTLIDAQQEAIDAIVALPFMARPHKWERTGRLPRSLRPILRRYAQYGRSIGLSEVQITRGITDIVDLVILEDNAQ
jgi:hypothetical protein